MIADQRDFVAWWDANVTPGHGLNRFRLPIRNVYPQTKQANVPAFKNGKCRAGAWRSVAHLSLLSADQRSLVGEIAQVVAARTGPPPAFFGDK
jgi:hypothetical protein